MGVSGCGKSTIGAALAARLGGRFLDCDEFHPPANIEKMRAGTPLTDEDRWPWLARIGREIAALDGIVVAGCSALRRIYRERIGEAAGEPVMFVHLRGSRELIAGRMAAREGHFMPPGLLDSQFATLETPTAEETAIGVDILGSAEEIVARICAELDPPA